jgi:GDSL-like lipase/acylhydrolase family protein
MRRAIPPRHASRSLALHAIALALSACTLSHAPFTHKDKPRRPLEGDSGPEAEADDPAASAARADGSDPPAARAEPTRVVVRSAPPPTSAKPSRASKVKGLPPEAVELNTLARQLHAEPFPLENPCVSDSCPRNALDRFFARLRELEKTQEGTVRILHLGDSHVAADYITGTARRWLQHRFGEAGRGFVAVDQRAEYSGRRLHRKGWKRTRIVDKGRAGGIFGFSGMALESNRPSAKVDFVVEPEDAEVVVYYHAQRTGSRLRLQLNGTVIGEVDTRARDEESRAKTFKIPAALTKGADKSTLSLIADDAGVRVMGLSFESGKSGMFYDAIGPVGADARVYMTLNQKSFRDHLRVLNPALIVMMVGGNDALAMREGKRTLADVRTDHERVIEFLRDALPEADCMLWSPMDAGERVNGEIQSKKFISEVRNMQKAAATKMGCAFWDMFESMGREGAFKRWHDAGIMNDDLVHPRAKAGELLGHLFATSLLEAYEGGN